MPLHEYLCQKCGEKLEIIQKFSDKPLTKCASCGGKLERLLFAPAIKFKGSGWYITDYAKNNGQGTSSDGVSKDSGATAKEDSGTKSKAEKSKDSSTTKKSSGAEKTKTAS